MVFAGEGIEAPLQLGQIDGQLPRQSEDLEEILTQRLPP
jgi:hypothetical protein